MPMPSEQLHKLASLPQPSRSLSSRKPAYVRLMDDIKSAWPVEQACLLLQDLRGRLLSSASTPLKTMAKRKLRLFTLALASLTLPVMSMGQDSNAQPQVEVSQPSKPADFNDDIYYRNKLEYSHELGVLPANILLSSMSLWAIITRKSPFITRLFPYSLPSDGRWANSMVPEYCAGIPI
jgi:hypothetical protein